MKGAVMYGDTSVIRGLAGRLREQGAEVRCEAEQLVARAESVPWTGQAAEAMRRLVRDQAGSLHTCADRHEEAAEALERHAHEVDRLVALIAAAERRLTHAIEGALDRLGAGVGGGLGLLGAAASHVVHAGVDEWLRHVRPPPSGSKEWLDIDVPPVA